MKRTTAFCFPAWLGRLGPAGIATLLGVMPLFPGVLSAGDLVVTVYNSATGEQELQHLEKDDFSVVRGVPIQGKIKPFYISLFRHPGTGVLYGLQLGGMDEKFIYAIDEETGMGTKVVTIDAPVFIFTNLTFGPRNELYGIESGNDPLIYRIDLETGVATETGWTVAGNTSEHVLEYNPDDLKFYHFYDFDDGGDRTLRAETFTPQLGGGVVAAPVPLDLQASPEELVAITYVGSNQFIAVDDNGDAFYRLTVRATDILAESIGNPGYGYNDSGLELEGRNLIMSSFGKLRYLNPSTLVENSDLPTRIPGNPFVDCLVENPADFRLYSIGDGEGNNDKLVAINPANGEIEWEKQLTFPERDPFNWSLYGLAFVDGTLYGVVRTGDYLLCTIDRETGEIASTGLELGNASSNKLALVFDPQTGQLYHIHSVSTGTPGQRLTRVEAIDLAIPEANLIASLDIGLLDGATRLPETGEFLLLMSNDEAYTWSPGSDPVLAGTPSWAPGLQYVVCQPDLAIGPKLNRLRGNNRRNGSGAGQKTRIVQKRKRAGKVFVRLENDANDIDAISLRGTKGNRKMKLVYKLGGANITGAVRRGAYEKTYLPREASVLLIKFRRKSQRTARRTVRLISRSADGVDVAVAKIILKP